MDTLSLFQSLSVVPVLEVDGGNWPTFRRKFETHIVGAGLEEHFSKGNTPAESYEDVEAKPTKMTDESDDDFKKRADVWAEGETKWKEMARAWKRDDAKARMALGDVVQDSTFMEILEFKTFHEMWEALETHFDRIALHQIPNLKRCLNQMYCDEGADVAMHLQEMEWIYQQLASRNAKISDEDYVDAIIRSLPQSYSSLMISFLRIYDQMKIPITPAVILDVVRKEHWARQMVATPRNRRPNEITRHADTIGCGRGQGGPGGRGGNFHR